MSVDKHKLMVAVVIPIYRPFNDLSVNEIKSLVQIRSVLSSRDIFFIHPQAIDAHDYVSLLKPLNVRSISISDRYFGSLDHCNKLFESKFLYEYFSQYDYMLLHHTDAYVFSDQLDYWCAQNYDYIGAPWFEGNKEPNFPLRFKGVGNGGFSLRKISTFLKITDNRFFITAHFVIYKLHKFLEGNHYLLLRKYLGINSIMSIMKRYIGYEDEFWGIVVPKFYKSFLVAKPEQALKFSFEVMPRALLELNNNELPFGCHAWEKYDPEFWRPFIQPCVSKYEETNIHNLNSKCLL